MARTKAHEAKMLAETPARHWPADKVERRSVESLTAHPQNPRIHSDAQVDQLVAAMREFGWTIPILVDEEGGIIAGHGRLAAAEKLRWTEVPVMVASGWTEAQKTTYRIWDNQSALLSTWDDELLKINIEPLKLEGYDMQLLGFSDDQLNVILDGWSQPEDVAERDGSHTRGISTTIFIVVRPADADAAKAAVSKALGKANIEHELR